jgi:hypothetical protein
VETVYKKHYPPALDDEVWRLDRIAKDGACHKRLSRVNINTIEQFLRFHTMQPTKLRQVSILCHFPSSLEIVISGALGVEYFLDSHMDLARDFFSWDTV